MTTHRLLFASLLTLILATPLAWAFAADTLSFPLTQQPPMAAVPAGASVPLLSFTVANTSGTTVGTLTGITLHQSGTIPKGTLTGIHLVDTTANYLAAEATGSALFDTSGNTTLHLPLVLNLRPGETHFFTLWGTLAKPLPSGAAGKYFGLNLESVSSSVPATDLPILGTIDSIAADAPLPAPTCYMSVNPSAIAVGDSVTIRWTSRNASSGYISSIGSVGPSGSLNTLPSSAHNSVFEGTFQGQGGLTHCSASVTVTTTSGGGSSLYPMGYALTSTQLPGSTPLPGSAPLPGASPLPGSKPLPASTPLKPLTVNTNTPTSGTGPIPSAPAATGQDLAPSIVPRCGFSFPGYLQKGQSSVRYTDPTTGNVITKNSPNIPEAVAATSCNLCDFGQLIQNIINYLIFFTIPLSVGLFAYAGVIYFTARGDTHKIQQAHAIFSSVVIGFAIAVSGYLIVQTVLNGLLSSAYNGGNFRWTQLDCADKEHNDPNARPRSAGVDQIFASLYGANSAYNLNVQVAQQSGGEGLTTQQCTGDPACSPTGIQQAATSVGLSLTQGQANALSCIAATESAGGQPNTVNTTSGACGLFQVLPSNWQKSSLHQGSCSVSTPCTDAVCNTQTAVLLGQGRLASGGSLYGDWTCPRCNAKAQGCVNQYDPGN